MDSRPRPRCPTRPPRWAVWLICSWVGSVAWGQQPTRELLNSERIEQEFGSYGIEVLEASDTLRISNLYSRDGGARTCRTFAVVRYPAQVDPAVAAEHAAIVKGGSIGAVFAAQGWQVRKTHLYYGELRATTGLASLMGVGVGTPLAQHAYVLDVAKNDRVIEYAALVEIHHPEYLRLAELPAIYGPATAGPRTELLAALLTTAAAQVAR